ncbi:hypothetical protein [uncultured Cohaesibacter sp.]|uniref:hypothetical protein n=1 Tax=uncultured Cohaesibacter sp. TaxID=1002546 RepID=UPI0029C855CE|nr:hypothetical protein [uncultured Cohaesibacter sp.]
MKSLKGSCELQQPDPAGLSVKRKKRIEAALAQIERAHIIGAALARKGSGTAGEENSGPDMPDASGETTREGCTTSNNRVR